jgi:hypothetical protein
MNKSLVKIVAAFFIMSTLVFAVDKSASPTRANTAKANVVKAAKMHATGRVVEVSDELIKIERTVKGDIETMEFTLEKPSTGIIVNDSVKIDYTENDGNLIALRVSKVTFKTKEIKPLEVKPVPGKK